VPAGYVGPLPVGVSFIGRRWDEPKLTPSPTRSSRRPTFGSRLPSSSRYRPRPPEDRPPEECSGLPSLAATGRTDSCRCGSHRPPNTVLGDARRRALSYRTGTLRRRSTLPMLAVGTARCTKTTRSLPMWPRGSLSAELMRPDTLTGSPIPPPRSRARGGYGRQGSSQRRSRCSAPRGS